MADCCLVPQIFNGQPLRLRLQRPAAHHGRLRGLHGARRLPARAALARAPTRRPEPHDRALARARLAGAAERAGRCAPRATAGFRGARYESLNLGDHVGDERAARGRATANRLRPAIGARAGVPAAGARHRRRARSMPHRTRSRRHCGRCLHGYGRRRSWPARSWWPTACRCCSPTRRAARGGGACRAGAGWRPACSNGTVAALSRRTARPGELMAWLGPCIGPRRLRGRRRRCAAAFGAGSSGREAACFRPAPAPGKWLADLAALARQRLRAVGVERFTATTAATPGAPSRNPSRFFSHRRDGVSGRFAALAVWRAPWMRPLRPLRAPCGFLARPPRGP